MGWGGESVSLFYILEMKRTYLAAQTLPKDCTSIHTLSHTTHKVWTVHRYRVFTGYLAGWLVIGMPKLNVKRIRTIYMGHDGLL